MHKRNQYLNFTREEIIATGAVFLLASSFFWYYFVKDDNIIESVQIAPSVVQSDSTSLRTGDIKQNPPQLMSSAKSSMATSEVSAYSAQQPSYALQTKHTKIRKKRFEDKNFTSSSQGVVTTNHVTPRQTTVQLTNEIKRQANTDAATSYRTQSSGQQIVANPQGSKAADTVTQLNQSQEEAQSKLENIPSLNHSIKSDVTQVLRLQGTAAPDSQVVLFLNGYRVSSIIQVNPDGQWNYETDIDPGKYTVRVIDDQNLTQSENLQIVVPVTQPESQTQRTVTVGNLKVNGTFGDRQHQVKAGETFYSLSKLYHVTITKITQANDLSTEVPLEIDQLLEIPKP
ncbi:MAG: LysM peptidoglycan-binding domain-containing protein [Methylococcales bacterium]